MSTLEKVKAVWGVLQPGKTVLDSAKWKEHQISVNQVAAAIAAVVVLAKAFGYDLHMDDQTIALVAGGIFGIVNWLLTVATTDKVGIFGRGPSAVAGTAGDVAATQEGGANAASRFDAATLERARMQIAARSGDASEANLRGGPN